MVSKKADIVLNFYLTGNIPHNFLVPRMIELARKTFFRLIETLVSHRVPYDHLLISGQKKVVLSVYVEHHQRSITSASSYFKV